MKGPLTEFHLVGVEFWWHFVSFANKFYKENGPVQPMIADSENKVLSSTNDDLRRTMTLLTEERNNN